MTSEGLIFMADATLKEIREFFGMTVKEFREEWMPLPKEDKDQIKSGLGNGSLTY